MVKNKESEKKVEDKEVKVAKKSSYSKKKKLKRLYLVV